MVAPLHPDDPTVLGSFRLSARLGEGGQGVVYLGHTPDGEPVAVKLIKTGLDPAVRTRLSRELDAMRSIAPFCTARVLTAEVDRSEPYIVTEFVDGPSLQQRVTDGGPLRGGELDRLAVGTATALTAIHGAGIVHRDFKPGNVLLGPDGPRVVDFGIARQGESDTITAGPIGTPAYLAPEQISGSPASPASDVFAWGATIVFAATGKRAFDGGTVASVLHQIMTTDPDVSAVPAPLRDTVQRCLAKDPAARPTARDLLLGLVGSTPDPLAAGAAVADATNAAAQPPATPYGAQPPVPQPPVPQQGATPMPGPYDPQPAAPYGTRAAEPLATEPAGNGRRRSRKGLIGGLVVLAAAVVTAALVLPSLLPSSKGGVSRESTQPPASEVTHGTDTYTDPATPGTGDGGDGYGNGEIPAAFAGTWRGHITGTPAIATSEYDLEIDLDAGDDTGKWKQTSGDCEGKLSLTGVTAAALTFRLEDAGQCVPGTVRLARQGDGLSYQWSDDLGLLTENGDLTKVE
ncbi:serine/threonine-protein kinase [Planotetraspora thailandica]|nr:serine/threonine-protein kinase [Planotetraspora thailandica]